MIHSKIPVYSKKIQSVNFYLCFLFAIAFFICIGGDDVHLEIRKKLFNVHQTSKALTDIIKKHGWKYQHYTREYYVDVTKAFDNKSETGNLLLDWLAQTNHFRATMNDEIVQEITSTIARFSKTIQGKQLCRHVDEYIFISK